MDDMEKAISKNAKLSIATKDNTDSEYNKNVESAYIRQDKMLAAQLKEKHKNLLAELSEANLSKDEAAFSSVMEKLSKMGEVICESNDTDASSHLASFTDDSESADEKKAELAELSSKITSIETMLSSVLSGNKIVKFSAEAEADEEGKIESKLFSELDTIIETLKKSHSKYGD